MSKLLTAKDAAEELGYNIHHLYKLLRTGTIKAEQFSGVWMIPAEEVERIKSLQGPKGRMPKRVPKQLSG
jgi:predicted site-specific integrase-resolvase